MDIEFSDTRLALIETDRAADTRLPVAVIQGARQSLRLIRAAPDIRTIRNWRSLGYGVLHEEEPSLRHGVRVNGHWRMCLHFDHPDSPTKVTVTSIKEYLLGEKA